MVRPDQVFLLGHRTVGLDDASAAEVARLPRRLRRIDAPAVIADPAGAGRRAATLAGTGHPVWRTSTWTSWTPRRFRLSPIPSREVRTGPS